MHRCMQDQRAEETRKESAREPDGTLARESAGADQGLGERANSVRSVVSERSGLANPLSVLGRGSLVAGATRSGVGLH